MRPRGLTGKGVQGNAEIGQVLMVGTVTCTLDSSQVLQKLAQEASAETNVYASLSVYTQEKTARVFQETDRCSPVLGFVVSFRPATAWVWKMR